MHFILVAGNVPIRCHVIQQKANNHEFIQKLVCTEASDSSEW
jgi:hypothetical protein